MLVQKTLANIPSQRLNIGKTSTSPGLQAAIKEQIFRVDGDLMKMESRQTGDRAVWCQCSVSLPNVQCCAVVCCGMVWLPRGDGLRGFHSESTHYVLRPCTSTSLGEESVGPTQAWWGTDKKHEMAGERRTSCGETLAHGDRDLRQIRGNSGIVRGLSGVHFGLFNCDLVLVIAGRYRLESGVWSLRNVLKKAVSLAWPAEYRR